MGGGVEHDIGGSLSGVAKAGLAQAGTEMSRGARPHVLISLHWVQGLSPSPAQGLQRTRSITVRYGCSVLCCRQHHELHRQ